MVFGRIFNSDMSEYAPFVLSGMIVWDFTTATTIGGSTAFLQADAYIKQSYHPLAIYTLRTTLTNLLVLVLASTGLIVWVRIAMPQHFGWCWVAALLIFPMAALIAWPMATLFAYISTRFRDVPHALGLVLQALYFVSPIYFETKVFRSGGLDLLVDYNPIYHLLEIVRAPLLNGEWPTWENYIYCLGTLATMILLAWLIGRKAERNVIFYL